ncbi:methyltransferase, FkbM family [Actinokineospora alba]|uniref:Methyltransferase, FkbM family n=1 Tax=Actinokineospora alba TaxID=504798 RepID=A0A1H0W9U4_9PSEU|nr:FkbM family methyltransferase [Actinokineospora alba]TDP66188.1 FkbM family methyltransferase [Actinokineospora alba]SDJ42444.1 methyltransferase, FkbM family [Actinokineospora alba]SDP87549.1 methyltransferase, FkbM family [Actinokineospora alba]
MISYAQNAEDVVLARLFGGQASGRYVDIGAGDPVEASVTKAFYDLGWRGINIEPIPALGAALRAARPDDVTLGVAVGAGKGTATLHVVDEEWGWSTLDQDLAGHYRDDRSWRVDEIEVDVLTLADILDQYPGPVDFLKVDVEGAEQDVIDGGDWTRHRPRVLVVEATEPGSPTPAHQAWEPTLLAAGYRCALFDGLNRFYAQADDTEALDKLSVPANVFDKYQPYAAHQQAKTLADIASVRAAESGYIRRLEESLRESSEAAARDAEHHQSLEAAISALRADLVKSHRYSAALESRIAELENLLAASAPARPTNTH